MAEILQIEKKNYYKKGHVASIIGGFIVCFFSSLPYCLYSSYNTLYSLYLSFYADSKEEAGAQEVLNRSLLLNQCESTFKFFQLALIIVIVLIAVYVLTISTLYLIGYVQTNRNKD